MCSLHNCENFVQRYILFCTFQNFLCSILCSAVILTFFLIISFRCDSSVNSQSIHIPGILFWASRRCVSCSLDLGFLQVVTLFLVFNISLKSLKWKVHDSEAFWSEKWAFWTVDRESWAGGEGLGGSIFAQRGVLCAAFLAFFDSFFAFFCSFRSVLSTPNFQKSTPFENLALTFFSRPPPFFAKIGANTYIPAT